MLHLRVKYDVELGFDRGDDATLKADAWLDAKSLHNVKWLPADEGLILQIQVLLG